MEKDFTDEELRQIITKKREEIQNYRQERGKPRALKDSLVGIVRDRKQKKKEYGKNRRELPESEYVLIPNEFIEAIYKQDFGRNQSKILWFIVRKTWGWQKQSEFIRVTRCAKELGIPKQRVSEALSSLLKRNIVTVNRDKTYAIQMDISLWRDRYGKKGG